VIDVEKLLAAIAETERRARAASPGPWHANAEHDEVLAVDGEVVCEGFALSSNQLRATVDFIVDNDPSVALRRCTAEKRLIAAYQGVSDAESDANDGHKNPAVAGLLAGLKAGVVAIAEGYGITEEI
jgi:hypothetical protein